MILNKKILDVLIKSNRLKQKFPIVKKVDTRVVWDGDVEYPMYDIDLKIHIDNPEFEDFDVTNYINTLIKLLSGIGVHRTAINQVYSSIYNDSGEKVFPRY